MKIGQHPDSPTSLPPAGGSLFIFRLSVVSLGLALAGCGEGGGTSEAAPAPTPIPAGAACSAPAPTPLPSGPPAGAACPTTNSNVALADGMQLAVGTSRAAGVAPLAVFFDASATTATSTTRPFHDLEYRWRFGESNSGTWNCGAKAGTASRNEALGPVAAHVFESAGIYPITVSAFNGTSTVFYSCNITVTPADTEFAGNKTVCVSGAGNFEGCPAGALPVTSSNPTTAVANNIGAGNKRILFRRGESFSVSAPIAIDRGGPSMLGAFGTGAKPIFTATTINPIFNLSSQATPTRVSDWRFQDIAANGGPSGAIIFFGNGHASRMLINRVDTSNTQGALTLAASQLTGYNAVMPFTHAIWDEFYLANNSLGSLYLTNGNAVFANSRRFAALGNTVDTAGLGEHGIRMQLVDRGVFSHNTIQSIAAGRHHLTLRGVNWNGDNTVRPGTYSEKVVVSDNKFTGGGNGEIMTISAQFSSANERGRNFIVERNWFDGSAAAASMVKSAFTDVTIRNNVASFPSLNGGGIFASVKDEDTSGAFRPDRVNVYNNTVYLASTSANYFALFFAANNDVRDLAGRTFDVRNNILYAPSSANAFITGNTASATITPSNNSSNVGSNPLFASTPPLTVESFRIGAGSYANGAATVVPVWSDFFGVPTTGAPRDMGAVAN